MKENEQLRNEVSLLKKELAIYKRMTASLPFSFIYKDSISGVQMKKEEGKEELIMGKIYNHPFDHNVEDELEIISEIEAPFETIEAFLLPILDLVPHHIVFINQDGIITLCNLQTAKDLHVKREEIVGRHIRELLQIPDKKIVLLETLSTQKNIINREILDRNYGIINTRIIRNTDGSIKRVIGTFQFLNAIREAEKQALAGRIAAGIAHEIRNPLTTVRGYLQLLQHTVDNETSQLFSSLLIPEIDRANKIITDFLRIAKPAQTSTEQLQVQSFLSDYLGNFLNSEALLYNVQIDYEISPAAGRCWIEGNRDELLQVFINLFRNSLQAKNENPLKIKIKAEADNSKIIITFQDNGVGIPQSILNHIFDPFFSTKDEGTGLGLSVSKKIIENYKGTMSVSSRGTGTAFDIQLPILFRD